MSNQDLSLILKELDRNTELKHVLRHQIKQSFADVIDRIDRIEAHNGDET